MLTTVCLRRAVRLSTAGRSLDDGVVASADRVADALTQTVLLNSRATAEGEGIPDCPCSRRPTTMPVVHQAVGMVSDVDCGVTTPGHAACTVLRQGQPVAADR